MFPADGGSSIGGGGGGEEQWAYHVTTAALAELIKIGGMSTQYQRTGKKEANPSGAFAKDRDAGMPGKVLEYFKVHLAYLIALRVPTNDIYLMTGDDIVVPAIIEPGGDKPGVDPGNDYAWVDNEAMAIFLRIKAKFNAVKDAKLPKKTDAIYKEYYRAPSLASMAAHIIQEHPAHVLTRLAKAHAAGYYRVEELQTSTHVYFSWAKHAVSCYADYRKKLESGGGGAIVVLRAALKSLKWEQDMAEYRAIKVEELVTPDKLQIMADHTKFRDTEYRCDAGNWQALRSWAG
ncbi:hypothetical protein HSX11_14705 [Oxalobacteraceae bacterium]|nr:hypothetical protein [Oxalobacteraceae bacterium]